MKSAKFKPKKTIKNDRSLEQLENREDAPPSTRNFTMPQRGRETRNVSFRSYPMHYPPQPLLISHLGSIQNGFKIDILLLTLTELLG